eukprot:1920607-Lingulodinium_polyedra.AAC.1
MVTSPPRGELGEREITSGVRHNGRNERRASRRRHQRRASRGARAQDGPSKGQMQAASSPVWARKISGRPERRARSRRRQRRGAR